MSELVEAFLEVGAERGTKRIGPLFGPSPRSPQVNEGERSVVSMRDIGRAARVFKWSGQLRTGETCGALLSGGSRVTPG